MFDGKIFALGKPDVPRPLKFELVVLTLLINPDSLK